MLLLAASRECSLTCLQSAARRKHQWDLGELALTRALAICKSPRALTVRRADCSAGHSAAARAAHTQLPAHDEPHLDDAAAADEIFSVLMGEDVESRRSFIQRNAKDVRFLDI